MASLLACELAEPRPFRREAPARPRLVVSPSSSLPKIVGRDAELETIERWRTSGRPALLEIEGDAGIGKTTLWEEAARSASEAGALVLACRPVEVESAVAYGALARLLEPLTALMGDGLPAPRRRALEGALRLRDGSDAGVDETAVALGAVSALREAAACRPVVIAVDDVHWLDTCSRVVLTYALRSLRVGEDVAVALACRLAAGGGPLDLSGSDVALRAERLRLGPLSVGALHRIINAELGGPLSRPKLVRVHDVSRGNPSHALELARVTHPGPIESALAVPGSLADGLRARIEGLSTSARTLLLHTAAAGEPELKLLLRLAAPRDLSSELGEAIERGVLVVSGARVRFSHPLFASIVYGDTDELERREAHVRLAELAGSAEELARHLALAGASPAEGVASGLELGAESACRRGARGAGAVLFEQAAALTPPGDEPARDRRLIGAAHAHFQSGEPERARALLEVVAGGNTPLRFEALCRLGTLLDETVGGDASFAAFEGALETDDPAVASRAHRCLAQALVRVGRAEEALAHADGAVRAAERVADPVGLAYGLSAQALVEKIAGQPEWRLPLERGLALEAQVELPELGACPSAVKAETHRLLLELDDARTAYERLLQRSVDRGEVGTEAWCRFRLASVEIAAGRLNSAAEHARELSDLAEQTTFLRLQTLCTRAHLAVLGGDGARARPLLHAVVIEAEQRGDCNSLRAALHLEGFLDLSLGDFRAAIAPLERARVIWERTAVGEPGMQAFLLDEVDALAGAGDADGAAAALRAFEDRCNGQTPPWVTPLVQRARGLVHAAAGDLEAALVAVETSMAAEHLVPLPLERARTRLALGRILRRGQQRAAARATLTEALSLFELLGAPVWAERTREALGRIGGRAPSRDQLTPTERRIAELAGEGMTNREVAAALFVTSKTVESALTRIYRKLDVRSRTELARRLVDPG